MVRAVTDSGLTWEAEMTVAASRVRRCAVLAGIALLAGACSPGSSPSDPATITIALAADPNSVDPAHATTQSDAMVATALYDTLVRRDPQDYRVIPGLASSWTRTPSSVTFAIRDGVTCSDGTPVTAKVVADSVNRFLSPATKSRAPQLFFPGRTLKATADEAAKAVTVSADKPWADLLPTMAQPALGVVCPAGLRDPKTLGTASSGTGPYVLTRAERGVRYVLKRRDDYTWGRDGANDPARRPAELTYQVVTNESTVVNLLLSGELSAAVLLGPDSDRLAERDGLALTEHAIGTTFLQLNEAPGRPLADPALRRAVIQAIDKQAFAAAAFGDRAKLLDSIGGPDAPCAVAAGQQLAFDAAAARKALAGKRLRVLGTTQVGGGAGTEYVRAALGDADAQATLKNTDTTTWARELLGGGADWDVTVMAVADPISLRGPASHFAGSPPPAGTNLPSIDSPAFQKAFTTATRTPGQAGCAAWAEAQQALVAEAHTQPLATLPAVAAWSGVSGSVVAGYILGDTLVTS